MPTSIALLLLRDGENASYTCQHIKAYQDYPQARGILCAFSYVSIPVGCDLMLARSGLLALNTTQIITDQVSVLSNLVYTQCSPDLSVDWLLIHTTAKFQGVGNDPGKYRPAAGPRSQRRAG